MVSHLFFDKLQMIRQIVQKTEKKTHRLKVEEGTWGLVLKKLINLYPGKQQPHKQVEQHLSFLLHSLSGVNTNKTTDFGQCPFSQLAIQACDEGRGSNKVNFAKRAKNLHEVEVFVY